MNKEERYDLIEQYIHKALPGEALRSFEEQLNTDASLKQELKLHQEVHDALGNKRHADFLALVKASEHDYFSKKKHNKERSLLNPYWAVAAAVTLLLIAGIALYLKNDTPDTQELFVAYFEPYEVPGNFRSENSGVTNNTFWEAVSHYEERQYQQAIPLFDQVIHEQPQHAMAVFLRGISHLALDNTALAEADFTFVASGSNTLFMDQAKWYLALTYLKQGKPTVAKSLLDTLRQANPSSGVTELWQELE